MEWPGFYDVDPDLLLARAELCGRRRSLGSGYPGKGHVSVSGLR
jgi:hypothetical protein